MPPSALQLPADPQPDPPRDRHPGPQGLTPSQTVGPYLAIGLPWPDGPWVVDEDAEGAITISGQVVDGAGSPVPDALVETRQAGPGGRRRGQSGAGRACRDLAGRAGRQLRPSRRPAGRRRSGVPRVWPVPDRRGGPLPDHHAAAGRAAGPGRGHRGAASGRIGFRPGPARPGGDADLLPRRAGGERRRPGAAVHRGPRPAGDTDREGARRRPAGGVLVRHPAARWPRDRIFRCLSLRCLSPRLPRCGWPRPWRWPAGAPFRVLGNSLGTSCAVWEPQRAVLPRHFRLLRYEHRGHGSAASAAAAGTESGAGATGEGASPGRSPALPGPYTIAELGADVLALLDSRGIGRAMYCGASLGGMIGMWLAASAPERITALGLCCTSANLPPADLWAGRAGQARSGEMGALAGQIVGRWFTPAFQARGAEVPAACAP